MKRKVCVPIVRTPPFLKGGVGLPQNWQEGGGWKFFRRKGGDAKKGGARL